MYTKKPPLTKVDFEAVVDAVLDTRSVLVGGQAVAYWVNVYDLLGRRISAPDEPIYVSKDVDFLGTPDEAKECADRLGGGVQLPIPFVDQPINAAVVTWVDSQEHPRSIDFLNEVLGIDRAELVETAVRFVRNGRTLHVMHPVKLLRSRIVNVASLPGHDDPQHIAQAKLSILVAKEWLADRSREDARAALLEIEEVFRFSKTLASKRAFRTVGLDPFDAVFPFPGLPRAFVEKRYPQMRRKIQTLRAKTKSASDT
jgi:hypothetical protein